MKPRALYIGIGLTVVVGLLLFTVLSKKWWARRIMAKWNITSNLAGNAELLRNTSLARMVEIYREGMEGWELRGTTGSTTQTAAVDDRELVP